MMGNLVMAQMEPEASPASPLQLNLLVFVPHMVGAEIEVRMGRIVAKADMPVDSVPEVAVFVKFGLVTLDFYPGRSHGQLSGQGSFLGRRVPAEQKA